MENETTQPYLSFESVFVGVSRVKLSTDLFVMPLLDDGNPHSFEHLARLRPSRNLLVFLSGFAVDLEAPSTPCSFDAKRAFATLVDMIRAGCAGEKQSKSVERAETNDAQNASRRAVALVAAAMRAGKTSAPLSGQSVSHSPTAASVPSPKKFDLCTLDKKRRKSESPKQKVAVPKISGKARPSTAATKAIATNPPAQTIVAKAPIVKVDIKARPSNKATVAQSGTAAPTTKIDNGVIVIDGDTKAAVIQPAGMDADLRAGIAANLDDHLPGTKPTAAQAAVQAALAATQAERQARLEQRKASWQTRLDALIAQANVTRTALLTAGKLHAFQDHHRRRDQLVITKQQSAAFWALPGVAQRLRHLRYDAVNSLNGLFDTMKWSQPGIMHNTCPFDSMILMSHLLLCTDAVMLELLVKRATDGTAKQRSAAGALLDMHRFASLRMWDEARLIIVRHAIFVGSLYTNVAMQSTCFNGRELNLEASPDYVDSLFTAAGVLIGSFKRVSTTTCDRADCPRSLAPFVKEKPTETVLMPKPTAAIATFEECLRQINSTVAHRCGHECVAAPVFFLLPLPRSYEYLYAFDSLSQNSSWRGTLPGQCEHDTSCDRFAAATAASGCRG